MLVAIPIVVDRKVGKDRQNGGIGDSTHPVFGHKAAGQPFQQIVHATGIPLSVPNERIAFHEFQAKSPQLGILADGLEGELMQFVFAQRLKDQQLTA